MKQIYNITILGGTDGFGKWLAGYILKHFPEHVDITITGKNAEKGEALSLTLSKREKGNKVSFTTNNIEAVKTADIVIYSVPIAYTKQVIEETLPYIRPGAVVTDVTSIKKFPSTAMNVRDDITVIPCHPMFGPYISSIAGQVCVVTPDEEVKDTEAYKFLYSFLKSQKARVVESTPEYHDKMMAVVQGLTHLNMFVVGETMKRLQCNISDSMNFISPIYKLMISSVGRYLGQNPELYADIQMYNDEVLEVHEKFLDTAKNFHSSIQCKDKKKFCQDIIEAREFLGVENCQEGQAYTDKVIYLLGKQIETLKKNVGKHIQLKNIYSGEIVSGELQDYQKGTIFFPSGSYSIDEYEVIEI